MLIKRDLEREAAFNALPSSSHDAIYSVGPHKIISIELNRDNSVESVWLMDNRLETAYAWYEVKGLMYLENVSGNYRGIIGDETEYLNTDKLTEFESIMEEVYTCSIR